LEIWDTTGQADAAYVSDLSFFQGLAFAPDGRLAGLANSEGSPARVARPVETAEEKSDGSESSAGQQTVLVSHGLDFVVTDDLHSPTAYIRGVWRPKKIRVPYGGDLKTLSLTAAVTPDGRFLALVGPDAKADDKATTVVVYRLKGDAYERWKKLRAKDETRRVRLSPDGQLLAMLNDDKTVQLWDLANERDVTAPALQKLKGIESLALSPDGRLLAATHKSDESESLFVGVWILADGVEIAALPGADSITEPVFSPDGRQLLGGGRDGVTRMLDLLSGRERRVLDGVEVFTAGFSRDGRYLGVITYNSELLVYNLMISKTRLCDWSSMATRPPPLVSVTTIATWRPPRITTSANTANLYAFGSCVRSPYSKR
jgi:WD40 repeat protein